ncbi:hypothetical protein I4F81_001124 [Pyropia yezoensis]|uniref:Uncharacterized protein n=1 Tax=Pyropia yezoensis TaxID=2788 RepID=A0ACC3BLM5_PYRYE|nr:hypothetical protein I4F81_001124 [Neopyropia yezoensis]
MAAPRFDGADFGDAALTGGSLPAARRGVAGDADGAGHAQRVQLLRPIGGRPSSPGRPASRVPPRPDRLVAALTRMLPAEFFAPPERVDISHLAAGGKTPLLVTRSKGRRFAGVANVWARDAATAAAEGGVIDKTTALMDRAVARVTGWLPPAGPAGGTGTSGR